MSVSAISPGVRADVSSSKTSSDHATYYTLYPNSTKRNLSLDRLEELAKQMNVDPIRLIVDDSNLLLEAR
ncbi:MULTISPECIES: hypothetical protein [Bacteria]|uniref:Uncharacterized protein n=1 Tax=Brevibacterium casei TaxID=33889 RepID=A0AB34XLD9_9MICO|nr:MULTISPECIES: hypothetical protein [Bacteria]NJE65952.1 hypothetical protein [Brevibacterium sp. LS14]SIH61953.1 Uncharacterised protein [Mycobacteroides abscessus subsp. abscessus]KZE10004.1 hypothetical protein AVW13_03625 [Brevibacterium casei]MCT1765730.1 hypothetical protein [Brevibacterium casei]MCT2182152.1 hypothetical protein [Brevibacterium casei]